MKVNNFVYSIILIINFTACVPKLNTTETDAILSSSPKISTSTLQLYPSIELLKSTATEPVTSTPTYTITPSPTPILNLKVMTYNILHGAGVHPDYNNYDPSGLRYEQLVKRIKEADPDVLGLQEAQGWDKGDPTVAEEFARELGMNYYFAPAPGDMHLMLLTKFEIIETENYSQEIGRGAFRTAVKIPDGGIFNFFVLHLNSHEASIRRRQVKNLIPKMAPFLGERTIIMGDLNASKDSPELLQLSNAGWIRIKHSMGLYRNIDQIWISPSVEWTLVTDWYQLPRQLDPDVLPISDHLPISVDLGIYASDRSYEEFIATESLNKEKKIQVPEGILEDLKVNSFHDFSDTCDSIRWASWSDGKFDNGKYVISGEEYWSSGARLNKLFQEGEAVLLEFQYSTDAEVNVILDNQQEWKSEAYKRFGVSIRGNDIRSDIYQGASYIGGYNLNPGRFESDRLYHLMLSVGKEGKFGIAIWDQNEIDNPMIYSRDIGEGWSNMDWSFNIQANKGQISIDNFTEILFGSLFMY